MNDTREQRAKPVPMAAVVDQWKETELSKSRNKCVLCFLSLLSCLNVAKRLMGLRFLQVREAK